MLFVKQELLGALARSLDELLPGAGARAAFESPKVAALGDLACTAAMQLAKPLKRNPRELANLLLAELPPSKLVAKAEVAGLLDTLQAQGWQPGQALPGAAVDPLV